MFFEALVEVLESLGESEFRSFWTLLLTGKSQEPSGLLTRLFLESGLIHLLVLSGSQIEHFRNFILIPVGLLSRRMRWSRSGRGWFLMKGAMFGLLAFYVWDVGEPAPLVRAFLLRLLMEWSGSRFSNTSKTAIAGALHIVLYPEHLDTASFYLSWTAYILLLAMARMRLKALAMLFAMSLLCQWAVCFLKGWPLPSIEVQLLGACMNVFMIPLFEKVIFPLGATLLIWGLLMMLCLKVGFAHDGLRWFFDSLRILYELPVELVLGVLKGIRYI